MSATNPIYSYEANGVQSVFTLIEKPDRFPGSNNATTSPRPHARQDACVENRTRSLAVKSPGVTSEPRQAWTKPADNPVSAVSSNQTNTVSPPGHLHDNKWAQIILRARQRQVSGDCESLSSTTNGGRAGTESSGSASSAAADAELKLTPQKLAEMWFSKKRSPKLELEEARAEDVTNAEMKHSVHEPAVAKSRLFGKAEKSRKDKKQPSLGKALAKKEEKETEEDREFKKQCQLELEKRLSECGFGIHASVKEKLTRDRKVKDLKSHKQRSLESAVQTEPNSSLPGPAKSSGNKEVSSLSPFPGCGDGLSHESGLEIERGVSRASMNTEQGLELHPESSKARSLPDDLTPQDKISQRDPTSSERSSTASLHPNQSEPEFHRPTRRARSLLDSFRDFASRPLWRKTQRQAKALKSTSTLDLITHDAISSQDGDVGGDRRGTEESRTNVLNQSLVDRGDVLRSVVFYQNRFIVVDQAKPGRRQSEHSQKKSHGGGGPARHSARDKISDSPVQNETKNYKVIGNETDTRFLKEGKLRTSRSFNSAEIHLDKLSLPTPPDPNNHERVEQAVTTCTKSESEQELEIYYNRVQSLSAHTGRSKPPDTHHDSLSNYQQAWSLGDGNQRCDLERQGQGQKQPDKPPQTQEVKHVDRLNLSNSRIDHRNSTRKVYSSDYQPGKDAGKRVSQQNSSGQAGRGLAPEIYDLGYSTRSSSTHRTGHNDSTGETKPNMNPGHRSRSRSAGDQKSRDCYVNRGYQAFEDKYDFDEEELYVLHATDWESHGRDGGRSSKERTTRSDDYETFDAEEIPNSRKSRDEWRGLNLNQSTKSRPNHRCSDHYSREFIGCEQSAGQRHVETSHGHKHITCSRKGPTAQDKDESIFPTADDPGDYSLSLPEEYIETFLSRDYVTEPKGGSRNVQFEVFDAEDLDRRHRNVSPNVRDFGRCAESDGCVGTDYAVPSRHNHRGQAGFYKDTHHHHGDDLPTGDRETLEWDDLEIEELDCSTDSRSKGHNGHKISNKNASGVGVQPRDSDNHNVAADRENLNTGHYVDTQSGNYTASRRVGKSSANPDRAFKTASSSRDTALSRSRQGERTQPRSPPTHQRTLYPLGHTATEDHPGHEKFHPGEKRPTRNPREFHPLSEGHSLGEWDNQPNQDDSATSHEEYQPSIKDYQPRRKTHPRGQRRSRSHDSHRRSPDGSRD